MTSGWLRSSAFLATALTAFIPNGVAWAKVVPPVPESGRLTVQVWLMPRNQAGAQRYALDVSTPGSRLFHHYLTPDAYTRRFGGSAAEATGVAAWLRRAGLTGVTVGGELSYVQATGVAPALHRAVRVPAALRRSVLAVTGLDAEAVVQPMAVSGRGGKVRCSRYYGQDHVGGLPRQFGVTRFPTSVCGYTAWQLRHALGANKVNTGRGETIALIELGLASDMYPTLRDYARASGLPAPARSRYTQLKLGKQACEPLPSEEEQLDVEAAYAMAPGAHELVVGANPCASNTLQALEDALVRVLTGSHDRPLASIVSNSWEDPMVTSPAQNKVMNAILVRAAAEGVGMYFCAGDHTGVETPSDQPFATGVGGTSLGIGRRGQRLFQTGWSSGVYSVSGHGWANGLLEWGTGGGPSPNWTEPGYQKGVVPAALTKGSGLRGARRSVPDLSAVADPATPMAVGLLQGRRYYETGIGGTSLATPLVAGLVADAQQSQARAFGFLNPVFYRLAGTRAFLDVLPLTSHSPVGYRALVCASSNPTCSNGQPGSALNRLDDESRQLADYHGQVTLKGYDNMTGLGTPDGQAFIAALRRLAG
jgi:subtilase family serine protease